MLGHRNSGNGGHEVRLLRHVLADALEALADDVRSGGGEAALTLDGVARRVEAADDRGEEGRSRRPIAGQDGRPSANGIRTGSGLVRATLPALADSQTELPEANDVNCD